MKERTPATEEEHVQVANQTLDRIAHAHDAEPVPCARCGGKNWEIARANRTAVCTCLECGAVYNFGY